MGRRLGALTADQPKCTLPVGNKTVIERAIEAFHMAGVKHISVVTGFAHQKLRHYPIKPFHNAAFARNNVLKSLMYARAELNGDTIVAYSDIIFEPQVVEGLAALQDDFSIVVDSNWKQAYIGRTEHPPSEAEKVEHRKGLVQRIGKHLSPSIANAEFTGIMRLSAAACQTWIEIYDKLENSDSGRPFQNAATLEQAYITDMLQELVDRGHQVHACEVDGAWMEIDTLQDLVKAERLFGAGGR